jgi:eukaryotic-like serine/threonine-protein kinase
MGEVYRARDTKLHRDVALKVLPNAFSQDGDRLARLRREAELLASLNHPHIAAIYGVEEAAGTLGLVLELVDGETLADRLRRGALPIDEALEFARQIADAVAAAHEQGVIHRDLKPANIALTATDQVKVLDFGLAKALEPAASSDGAKSPTLTLGTGTGVILGTAAHMSPEQAKGRIADRRTDVWAFGCLLYEMLTGTSAFHGEDVLETLTAVMRDEPGWSKLPAGTPAHVRTLLDGCLKKDRKERIASIAVVQYLLDAHLALPASDVAAHLAPVAAVPPRRRAIALAVAAVAGIVLGVALWQVRTPEAPPAPVTRFALTLGADEQFTGGSRQMLAISPDGTRVVYVANNRLFIRSMSEITGRFIPGTDLLGGVWNPVFSPDGQSIAFGAPNDNTVKRIPVGGGAPVTIASGLGYANSMSWGPDGIVVAGGDGAGGDGIFRVSPEGGTPEVLVRGTPEGTGYGPQILPGGETLLFTLAESTIGGNPGTSFQDGTTVWDSARIVAQSLESGARKVLIDGGSDARYLPTGHLVYARRGVLFAVAFDVARVEVTGEPVPILEGIRRAAANATGVGQVSISETGTIVYVPGPVNPTSAQLDAGLIDRTGEVTPLNLPPGAYNVLRLSPDGTHIAVGSDDGREAVVWIGDLAGTSSLRRLTFDGKNRFPIWSADSQHIAYQSDRDDGLAIFRQRADGSGAAERLTAPDQTGVSHIPEAWSATGNEILFRVTKDGMASLWTLSTADRDAMAFGGVNSPVATDATFSPDGRWVAYADRLDGDAARGAIYVQPFPATGAKYQITRSGRHPLWSRDGTQLLFVTPGGNQYAVASVITQPAFRSGSREPATRLFVDSQRDPVRTFDITAAGGLVGLIDAVATASGATESPQINVVLNRFEELKTRVPAK